MKKIFFSLPLLAGLCFSCSGPEKTSGPQDSINAVIAPAPYAPVDKGNGIFAFSFNGLYFEVDANYAARISNFSLDGKNILSGKEVNAGNWGTSLWPSPQSAWGWPPSKELDVKPYKGGVMDSLTMEFVSEKDSLLGIVFIKNYKANPDDTSVIVTYTMTNQSDKKQSLALWEISRVAPGGLTLYPTGKGKKQNLLAPLTKDQDGITWFAYDSSKIGKFKSSDVPKLLHDGSEGWMAQVSGDLLLMKKFADIPLEETAPGEGEIEFYANPDKTYIEIEQQGSYSPMEPGDSIAWEVKWYLRKLPSDARAEVGNKELVKYIRNNIK